MKQNKIKNKVFFYFFELPIEKVKAGCQLQKRDLCLETNEQE